MLNISCFCDSHSLFPCAGQSGDGSNERIGWSEGSTPWRDSGRLQVSPTWKSFTLELNMLHRLPSVWAVVWCTWPERVCLGRKISGINWPPHIPTLVSSQTSLPITVVHNDALWLAQPLPSDLLHVCMHTLTHMSMHTHVQTKTNEKGCWWHRNLHLHEMYMRQDT